MISFSQFQELVIKTKNSISPTLNLHSGTVQAWYNIYFRFYELEDLEKVFMSLAETGGELTLKNLLDKCKEWYGYNLHEEVAHCLKIMEQAKTEGKEIRINMYPKLKTNYRIPRSYAWETAFKLRS